MRLLKNFQMNVYEQAIGSSTVVEDVVSGLAIFQNGSWNVLYFFHRAWDFTSFQTNKQACSWLLLFLWQKAGNSWFRGREFKCSQQRHCAEWPVSALSQSSHHRAAHIVSEMMDQDWGTWGICASVVNLHLGAHVTSFLFLQNYLPHTQPREVSCTEQLRSKSAGTWRWATRVADSLPHTDEGMSGWSI